MRDTVHVGTVRAFNNATKVASVVIPALYGDTLVDAKPLTLGSADVSSMPGLGVGDNVAIFFDGGQERSGPLWFTGGGLQQVKWNTSRGVLPGGGEIFSTLAPVASNWDIASGAADSPMHDPFTYNFVAGRRYSFEIFWRAWAAVDGTITSGSVAVQVDGVTVTSDPWITSSKQWESTSVTQHLDCAVGGSLTPGLHTVRFTWSDRTSKAIRVWKNASYFIARDEGPITPVLDTFVPPEADPTIWNVQPLSGGWLPYGATWQTPEIIKENHWVSMRGLVRHPGPFPVNEIVASLAPEYWPKKNVYRTCFASFGSSAQRGACRIDVNPQGNVTFSTSFSIPSHFTSTPTSCDHFDLGDVAPWSTR